MRLTLRSRSIRSACSEVFSLDSKEANYMSGPFKFAPFDFIRAQSHESFSHYSKTILQFTSYETLS